MRTHTYIHKNVGSFIYALYTYTHAYDMVMRGPCMPLALIQRAITICMLPSREVPLCTWASNSKSYHYMHFPLYKCSSI